MHCSQTRKTVNGGEPVIPGKRGNSAEKVNAEPKSDTPDQHCFNVSCLLIRHIFSIYIYIYIYIYTMYTIFVNLGDLVRDSSGWAMYVLGSKCCKS